MKTIAITRVWILLEIFNCFKCIFNCFGTKYCIMYLFSILFKQKLFFYEIWKIHVIYIKTINTILIIANVKIMLDHNNLMP